MAFWGTRNGCRKRDPKRKFRFKVEFNGNANGKPWSGDAVVLYGLQKPLQTNQ